MGALCNTMTKASEDVWNWYFPEEIEIPECVLELLRFMYPTVDWSRVSFYRGLPHLIGLGGQSAITLPSTYHPGDTNVYFDSSQWDPCSEDGLAMIVHEGFHVLQLQSALGGWGLGFARPFIIQYLACWAGGGFSYEGHPMEQAAYAVAGCPFPNPPRCASASLFNDCYDAGLPICDCSSGSPVLDQANLDSFKVDCADIVQTSAGTGFWESMADCVPGLAAIKEAADWWFKKLCEDDIKGSVTIPTGEGGSGPTDPTNPAPPIGGNFPGQQPKISIPLQWIACFFGLIGAGLLYLIYGLYYIIWTLLWTVVTIVLWIVKMVWELIGLIVSGIMWVVTGILCALEWIWEGLVAVWEKIREGLTAVCDWATRLEERCTEWEETRTEECTREEDQGYSECTREEDQGYNECAREADLGYNECCDWWPCSWLCDAWVWVSNIVCIAWTWVSHIVCVAWTWISHVVCVAWTWIVSRTCKAFTWVVTGATCWAR